MRDVERLKDKVELSLDSRQIFFLFFGGAVAACLVFVLGVMIGRRLEGRERVGDKAATTAAIDPLQALDELGGDEAAAEAAPKAEAPAVAPPAGKGGAKAAAVIQAPIKDEPKKAEEAKPEPAKEAVKVAEPVKLEAAKDVAPPPPKPEKAETETKPTDATSKKARYTLQLSSFQVKAEAEAFAAKVSKGGYKPYITESDVPGKGLFYRVRIGGYGSQDEALEAKTAFEGAMNIIAYVTKL